MKRTAKVARNTKETRITLSLNLDGKGRGDARTTMPFVDHMLDLFSKHSGIDLSVRAKGDTHIDDHHLVEDIGIALGLALEKALGDKKGIYRYGNFLLPMDESLSYVAVDLGGRPYFDYKVGFRPQSKAPFSFELFEDFFQAVAMSAKMNLHVKLLQGRNNHHIAESIFKGFAKALSQAVSKDSRQKGIPSTKGSLRERK
ncbi:MAG: imidazoleglycerol-phosphate dehydratase [Elusimicrobia bacterium RIFCSPLOWO2_01_FULL_60_11]|nr:MAG: imidazoleglycerol-phosphate dehydratase [Elusimicrobia bacterium RIFCSPLOWO2_01_FULL_60_11]